VLLQHVWQAVENRIFRGQQIIVRIYFHAYNRIRFGEGFDVLYRIIICRYCLLFYCGRFSLPQSTFFWSV
jgi:hypothetical protein